MKPIWTYLPILFSLGLANPAVSQALQDSESTPTASELTSSPLSHQPYLRLELRYPGVYRVTGKDLADAGADLSRISPSRLAVWNAGAPVPVDVKANNPQAFALSDYIQFIGEAPRGTFTRFMPNNLHNVYFVTWGTEAPAQFRDAAPSLQGPVLSGASFQNAEYLEKDYQFRYSTLPPGVTDNFYWLFYQAGQNPEGMFPAYLDFPGFDSSRGKSVDLTFRILGITDVSSVKPAHQFSVFYGDYNLGTFSFNGIRYHDFATSIPAARLKYRQRLTFHTPPGREGAVDLVALDNIHVSYPRLLDAQNSDYFVFSNNQPDQKPLRGRVAVSGLKPGSRIYDLKHQAVYQTSPGATTASVEMTDLPTSFVAVSPVGHMHVDNLHMRPPDSGLTDIDPDLETLVFYHPDLAHAADVYTRYRQSRGMKMKAVSVSDIYDSLNHGFAGDSVLKRYVRYAASRSGKLRNLVLFGDATFDYREARTDDDENPPRVLIPIHWVYNPATTWSGGYQDDNWYGSLAEPYRPDVAVGRIPANNNEEAMSYVRKLIEHEVLAKTRDDKALLISSVEKSFQELVQEVEKRYSDHFSTVTLLFPETSHATREIERLRGEIDSGVQLLYYVGHGGSLVWRVGPTDFQQQKDLFTPAEVRKLHNRARYPIVACSSCYTTSFDQAGSLGESLILQPEAGAIAVIGSPWKATVHESHAFNSVLFKYYFRPDVKRLGEAALLAHREITPAGTTRPSFQSFTLLGDPCLELVKK